MLENRIQSRAHLTADTFLHPPWLGVRWSWALGRGGRGAAGKGESGGSRSRQQIPLPHRESDRRGIPDIYSNSLQSALPASTSFDYLQDRHFLGATAKTPEIK